MSWKLRPDGKSVFRNIGNGFIETRLIGALSKEELDAALPADPVPMETVIADQISALKKSYNDAIQLPVNYMSTTFQADENSQNVLTKSLVAGSVPPGFFWLDSNNVQVPMTFTELQGLAAAMLVQGQAAFAKLQTLKAQVRAATTVEEVGLVVW